MNPPKSLYEPKLVDRWTRRYREFETDEMVRRLRLTRKKPSKQSQPGQPPRPKQAA